MDGLSGTTKEITDLFPYLSQLRPDAQVGIASKVHAVLFNTCAAARQKDIYKIKTLNVDFILLRKQ